MTKNNNDKTNLNDSQLCKYNLESFDDFFFQIEILETTT